MTVHVLTAAPPAALNAALAGFEKQFAYPLGPGRSFRVSHGADYPRFFRAVGDAACFVAGRGGEVLGVLGLAVTTLRVGGVGRPAVYLGDLKVAPAARGGRVLVRLADAAREWVGGRADCGFAVVMDGTRVTPDAYTGRLGIPPFRVAAKVAVLRVLAGAPGAGWEADAAAGEACFAALTADQVTTAGGDPAERSEAVPAWLVAPDGSACGRLEDTRRAKRLIADDGGEMCSAHLSCIGYRTPAALADLLRVAAGAAAARGFPALFAAVTPEHAAAGGPGTVVAPATVYAAGLDPGLSWAVNTAEV
ncbi:MAG: N-acetyltransferase [Isosphaera sp.]|nr:N-acetyltransferase [Isosphaera sp.]